MDTFAFFKGMAVGWGGKESFVAWSGLGYPRGNSTCRLVTAVVVVEVGDGGMRTGWSRHGNSPVSVRERRKTVLGLDKEGVRF